MHNVTTGTLFLIALLLVTTCDKERVLPSNDSNPNSAEQKTVTGPITIRSVELFRQPTAPNKTSTKFEEWKDQGDSGASKFPVFDVAVTIENTSQGSIQHGEYIMLTTIDFVIAPTYLHGGDVNRIMQHVVWSRLGAVDDVKMQIVPFLKSGDRNEVRIQDFNFGDLTAPYNGQDDTLWPWALRANVHILDREFKRVATSHAILKIIPSDSRLKKK